MDPDPVDDSHVRYPPGPTAAVRPGGPPRLCRLSRLIGSPPFFRRLGWSPATAHGDQWGVRVPMVCSEKGGRVGSSGHIEGLVTLGSG